MSLLHSPLICIGITGGIGSGKSYICRQLEDAGHPVFYCDDEAKRIIRTDDEVKAALQQLVGPQLYDTQGQLVKSILAAYLCKGRSYAAQVDAIVHPKVAQAFQTKAQQMADQLTSSSFTLSTSPLKLLNPKEENCLTALKSLPTHQVLFMECALLFEANFQRFVDYSVLVHVSNDTQINRLIMRDHITREKALEWIALQLPEEEKLQRADAIIYNE